MPTRDEMIRALQEADRQVKQTTPTREQMIAELEAADKDEETDVQDVVDSGETGIRSALSSLTLGASEPAFAAFHALDKTITADPNVKNDGSFLENLKTHYDESVNRRRNLKQENPVSNVAGAIGGALLPTGPAAMLTKGVAGTAGKLATGLGAKAAKVVGSGPVVSGIGSIARGGFVGGATAAGVGGAQQAIEGAAGFIKPEEQVGIGEMALTGAKWGAGLASLPQAYKASKYLGKKAMSTTLGVKGEVIDKYLKNADEINKAPTVEEIRSKILSTVKQLEDDVAKGQLTKEEAQSTLKAVQERAKELRSQAGDEFDRQRFDARDELSQSKLNLGDELLTEKEKLRRIPAPLHLADDVNEGIGGLKKQVSEGSSAAFDTLNGGARVDMNEPYLGLLKLRDGLKVRGQMPVTAQGRAAYKQISELAQSLFRLPKDLKPGDAKKIIQQLDRAEQVVYGSNEFTDDVSQAFKQVRRGIDAQLKQNPEYAAHMEGVASKVRLLEQLNSRFGNPQSRIQRLSGIDRETSAIDRDLLTQLEKLTGKNFSDDINAYREAQELLADPRRLAELEAKLPGFGRVQKAQGQVDRMSHPDARGGFIDERFARSGIGDEITAAEGSIGNAEAELARRQAAHAPFSSITDNTAQGKIESMMREKNPIHTRNTLEALEGASGQKFLGDIENRRVLDTFEKGNTNGSRNVNLFTVMGHSMGVGAGTGAALGTAVAGPVGAAVGAMSGAVVDKYGPQMAKGILDAVLKIEGTPSLQKIRALRLPKDVEAFISAQFVRHQSEVIRSGRAAKQDQKPVDDDKARSAFLDGN